MRKRKQKDAVRVTDGINALADMYVELSTRITRLEGDNAGLKDRVSTLERRVETLVRESAEYRKQATDDIIEEYFYGRPNEE